MNRHFRELVRLFASLPGIGPRHATRLVLALLERDPKESDELGKAIRNLHTNITMCPECYNVSDKGPCGICRASDRDARTILVVERVTDLEAFERSGVFRGRYHVLGGAINPVEGVAPEQLRIRELKRRVRGLAAHGACEVICATNPTSAGDMTATFVAQALRGMGHVTVTRLARGLSSGSQLENADEGTLRNALDARR